MSPSGHFEKKSDGYRRKFIGLILLQELTFWGSGKPSAREARAPFHAAPVFLSVCSSNLRVARPAIWYELGAEFTSSKEDTPAPRLSLRQLHSIGGDLASLDALKLPGCDPLKVRRPHSRLRGETPGYWTGGAGGVGGLVPPVIGSGGDP
jgi:hypothetical protein